MVTPEDRGHEPNEGVVVGREAPKNALLPLRGRQPESTTELDRVLFVAMHCRFVGGAEKPIKHAGLADGPSVSARGPHPQRFVLSAANVPSKGSGHQMRI